MIKKISYLVLCGMLIGSAMKCAVASQQEQNVYFSRYINKGKLDNTHRYPIAVKNFTEQSSRIYKNLVDETTGIGLCVSNSSFIDTDKLADLFGASELKNQSFHEIREGSHVLTPGFQPGEFSAPVIGSKGSQLIYEIANDFMNVFDCNVFAQDIINSYIPWLADYIGRYDKNTVQEVFAWGNFSQDAIQERLDSLGESFFIEYLRTVDVKDMIKEIFIVLFNRKIGSAVEQSAKAPNVGINNAVLNDILNASNLCVCKIDGSSWNQKMKETFRTAFETYGNNISSEQTQFEVFCKAITNALEAAEEQRCCECCAASEMLPQCGDIAHMERHPQTQLMSENQGQDQPAIYRVRQEEVHEVTIGSLNIRVTNINGEDAQLPDNFAYTMKIGGMTIQITKA